MAKKTEAVLFKDVKLNNVEGQFFSKAIET